MIPILNNPQEIEALLSRQLQDGDAPDTIQNSAAKIEAIVKNILQEVRSGGDSAIKQIIQRLNDPVLPEVSADGWALKPEAVDAACQRIPASTLAVLEYAARHIRQFAEATISNLKPVVLQHEGFSVGLEFKPVERVACYVPAGRFPLPSTALMTAITASVAGVTEICIISPHLTDEVIAAGKLAGATEFYQLGGAQAVAAMANGTESIRPVSMVVGPGNAFVTEAKRQLQGIIGIDMLAGPSEVVIIADDSANPEWLAWDMLAQAEHSPDACAYLITDSQTLADKTTNALTAARQNNNLPDYLLTSDHWGKILVLPDLEACVKACNQLAPEHVELQVAEPDRLKAKLSDYGALFMGYGTPVPFGDYAAGPNHTLPTNRSARFSGTLTPLTFLRPQSWIKTEQPQTSELAKICETFATLEGLTAHAQSSALRQ